MSSNSNNSKSITYSSTRGGEKHINFRTVVMQGLANDRGLFVPDEIPMVSYKELECWRQLKTYDDVAYEVISKFIKNDQIPQDKLKEIIQKSFHRSTTQFRHDDVTPVVQVGEHSILELFHGPTFAFKDIALQMLGNLFEYFLETESSSSSSLDDDDDDQNNEQQQKIAILGATSGDTGSAAISGLRGKKGIDCFILYPKNRVSTIQEQQMTTICDDNIHCIAIMDGTFDDCQDIVKASFNTTQFRKDVQLGAINSINWCRVLVQTTYYFWSYLRVTDHKNNKNKNISDGKKVEDVVNYSVPTGNFGDVLAGYYSKQMGLPIDKLIVATNENDILYRFFTVGEYHKSNNGIVAKTISPSMDICVSSNFERYLYHLSNQNSVLLNAWMYEFETTSKLTIKGEKLKQAQYDFMTSKSNTQQTLDIIKLYYEKYNYILCPHSAVGVCAIHQLALQKKEVSSSSSLLSTNTICLATAHHGKFPDAVKRVINPLPIPPKQLAELSTLPTKRTELPNDLIAVQTFVRECVTERNNNNNKKRNKSRSSSSSKTSTTTTTTCSICSTIKNTSITTTGACIAIGMIALVTIQIIRLSKKQQQRSL